MSTALWRSKLNALTKPKSYFAQPVPRNTSGYDKMAADLSAVNPNFNEEVVRTLAPLMMEWIQNELINGNSVTFENAFTFHISLLGRMDGPDDPLPERDDLVQVSIYAARRFVEEIRHRIVLERLAMQQKLPVITSTEDTKFDLADVLNPAGVLRLTGSNLFFDKNDPDCSCTIAGTESGETEQSTFAAIANSEILLVPDIPAQTNPWNNEYTVSITTQYTEHGSPRMGIYPGRLRTPLAVPGLGNPSPPETGILTDNSAVPYVGINGGTVSADERLRIQVILDPLTDQLLFNLIDMKEVGETGITVVVTQNGEYILPGFSGSAVSTLEITVNDYDALKQLVNNHYTGRLVDILDVTLA